MDICCLYKRCGEMSQNIHFFKDQMSKIGVSPREFLDKEVDMDLDDVEPLLPVFLSLYLISSFVFSGQSWRDRKLETEISKISANNDKLQRSHNDLVEYKILLDK
ncbi:hypothetical protein HID58_080171, partial [Brassica napus]